MGTNRQKQNKESGKINYFPEIFLMHSNNTDTNSCRNWRNKVKEDFKTSQMWAVSDP